MYCAGNTVIFCIKNPPAHTAASSLLNAKRTFVNSGQIKYALFLQLSANPKSNIGHDFYLGFLSFTKVGFQFIQSMSTVSAWLLISC